MKKNIVAALCTENQSRITGSCLIVRINEEERLEKCAKLIAKSVDGMVYKIGEGFFIVVS